MLGEGRGRERKGYACPGPHRAHIQRNCDPARNAWMELAFSLDLGIIDERDNSSIINTAVLHACSISLASGIYGYFEA